MERDILAASDPSKLSEDYVGVLGSDPTSLVRKDDRARWIDFWVICDERRAHLFFTREHRDAMVMTTKPADFPNGFAEMKRAFSPEHEAVHVYSVARPRRLPRRTVDRGPRAFRRLQSTGRSGWGRALTEEVSHEELFR